MNSQRLRKLARQGPLLAVAAVLLPTTRLGLRLMPFGSLVRVLQKVERSCPAWTRRRIREERITRAVQAASHRLPGTWTCLEQGLVARLMLRAAGYPARLVAGVARDAEDGLRAHAWVECEERVVLGATGEGFEPLEGDLGEPQG